MFFLSYVIASGPFFQITTLLLFEFNYVFCSCVNYTLEVPEHLLCGDRFSMFQQWSQYLAMKHVFIGAENKY
jgi:hypothetical protein